MITLTYGHKQPEDGDDSQLWFDALNDNIVLDDAHTHNGINSPILGTSSISKEPVIIKSLTDWSGSAGSWSLTIAASEIPTGFKDAIKPSSELCSLTIMDSDSSDEKVYIKATWAGVGNTTSLSLFSNTKLNIKVLLV